VLAITRKLGEFSRVGTDPPAPISVDAAMDEALALLRHSANTAGVRVSYRGAPDARVLARPGTLQQVLCNILQNAAQAMQGAGKIDADPGLSEVVELLLTREGYAVARAGTVKAGLERIRRARTDLVITDLRLPDGTGLDAIAAIRRMRSEVPIIMITSFSSLESAI